MRYSGIGYYAFYGCFVDDFLVRNFGLFGGIDAAATLYCVFPLESSAMCNKKAVHRTAHFVILCIVSCKHDNAQKQQKPLFRVAFLLHFALVIPAVEEVVLVYLKHSKRCAIFAVCAHITLTDELTC